MTCSSVSLQGVKKAAAAARAVERRPTVVHAVLAVSWRVQPRVPAVADPDSVTAGPEVDTSSANAVGVRGGQTRPFGRALALPKLRKPHFSNEKNAFSALQGARPFSGDRAPTSFLK